jgi:hypothetical protein
MKTLHARRHELSQPILEHHFEILQILNKQE